MGTVFDRCFHKYTYMFIFWQNETTSEAATSSSGEKEAEFDNKIEADRSRRFDFLLKQTEIFTHFMTNSTKSPTKPKGRPKKNKDKDKDKDVAE